VQKFVVGGWFILGPDTNILALTVFLISAPAALFNVFVATELRDWSLVRHPQHSALSTAQHSTSAHSAVHHPQHSTVLCPQHGAPPTAPAQQLNAARFCSELSTCSEPPARTRSPPPGGKTLADLRVRLATHAGLPDSGDRVARVVLVYAGTLARPQLSAASLGRC
jgi:hypothetical protein